MNTIYFIEPLSRGWKRMKNSLFNPFDLKKWFIIGFTAFLAGLTDCNGSGRGDDDHGGHGFRSLEDFVYAPRDAWDWLNNHPGWFSLILIGIVFVIALIILLIYLSSRGKFMFLDNVVFDRAEVVKPWNAFRDLAHSLFNWRLAFGFIIFSTVIMFIFAGYMMARSFYYGEFSIFVMVAFAGGLVLSFIGFLILSGYISLFLQDFVVPIMYKKGIGTVPAWKVFLTLFNSHLFSFIGYGILIFLLWVAIVICIVVAGLMTCCVGFLFLIIPYIGTVVLLPIPYTFRAFSVEFLEQFGPEFIIFPKEGVTPEAPGSSDVIPVVE